MSVESKKQPGWMLDTEAGTATLGDVTFRFSEHGVAFELCGQLMCLDLQNELTASLGTELDQLRAEAEVPELPEGWARSTCSDDSFVAMSGAFEVYSTSTGVRLRTPGKPSVPVPDVIEAAIAVARRNNATLPKWLLDADLLRSELDQKVERIAELERELGSVTSAAHEAGWNGVENSKQLPEFIRSLGHEDADGDSSDDNELPAYLSCELVKQKEAVMALERELKQRTEHEAADAARIAELEDENHRLREAMQNAAASADSVAFSLRLALGGDSEQQPKPEVKSPWPLRLEIAQAAFSLTFELNECGRIDGRGFITNASAIMHRKALAAARAADANPDYALWREQSRTTCVAMLQGWIGGGDA